MEKRIFSLHKSLQKTLKKSSQKSINQFRHRLSGIDALPQLTLVSIVIGLFAGSLIILFRLAIYVPLQYFLPKHTENFEGLPSYLHFLLPIIGAAIIALCFYYIPQRFHNVSVGNVLERLHNHQGRMSLGSLLVQFFGGIACLISGQSIGREGPAVHLGASTASILGQWLKLPNNSLRTLIGCGVAAAIAASFNTPIAGVIFTMEVVMMSYSIVGFIPIVMSAACGALMTRFVFGEEFLLSVTDVHLESLWELMVMIAVGFTVGVFATLYMRLQLYFNRFSHHPISLRIMLAGIVTGCIAFFIPEILGLGYDTVNLALEGQLALNTVALLIFAKILATSFSVGMGLPGGLIGPQLFIGACIGALIGILMNTFFPESSDSSFYVLLGMAAMMGAVINAPLAALMAVLELTYNPSIIFPSMLVIVIACLTTRQLYKCEGIFVEVLAANDHSLDANPSQQALSNVGVRSVMQTAFAECQSKLSTNAVSTLLQNNPLWLIVHTEEHALLLRAADLASYINKIANENSDNEDALIDLLEIPRERLSLSAINERATLYEAKQQLTKQRVDALYVASSSNPSNTHSLATDEVIGIVTHATIDNHYKL